MPQHNTMLQPAATTIMLADKAITQKLHQLLQPLKRQLQAAELVLCTVDGDVAHAFMHISDDDAVLPSFSLASGRLAELGTGGTAPIFLQLDSPGHDGCFGKPGRRKALIAAPVFQLSPSQNGILLAIYRNQPDNTQAHQFLLQGIAALLPQKIQFLMEKQYFRKQADLLDEVGDVSGTGGWQFDICEKKLAWTRQVYRIYGLPFDADVTPELALSHYTHDSRKQIETSFARAIEHGESYRLELPFLDAAGNHKWVRTTGIPKKDQDGKVIQLYGAFEDISAERAMLKQEQNSRQYLNSILDSLKDAVVTVDQSGIICSANKSANTMFGYSAQEWPGMSISQLMPEPYASAHGRYMEAYLETGAAGIIGVGRQLPAIRKNGDIFQIELNLTETEVNNQRVFIGIARDISTRLEKKETIYKMAFNDRLTGLPNRNWFEKELGNLLARASLQKHSIFCALIDIDNVAKINLRHGKAIGDRVIQDIANSLKVSLDRHHKLYKAGADSFYLVGLKPKPASDQCPSETETLVQQLDHLSHQKLPIAGQIEEVSFSYAMALFSADGQSVESMVDILEYSKKQAKQSAPAGRAFVGEKERHNYERLRLLKAGLKSAVRNRELQLAMQPQYLPDGSFHGTEALLRWNSATCGPVSPAEFIPLAEQEGLIIELENWVLEQVCALLASLRHQGIDTCISVNISGKHLGHASFKPTLMQAMEKWQIPASSLMLELTETALVSDIGYVKATMEELNQLGLRFSIDDFGTGYSSLAYLKELPIAELKIDRCFVQEIKQPMNLAGVSIVNMIIDMARALGVKTVAEGVETEEQLNYLDSHGCDYIQGYLLGKPMPVEAWCKRLTTEAVELLGNKSLVTAE